MKHDLSDVYWIGGSGCSGKSTVSRNLAKHHGFTVYHCDEHWKEHQGRSNPVDHPATFRTILDPENYFQLSPAEFDDASRAWFKEDFSMVLEDLRAMPDEKLIVEGVSLEPDFIREIADTQRTIFMIASEEFQRERFLEREFQREFFKELSDPERAFEDFIANLGFQTQYLHERVTELGFKVLITDDTSTVQGSLDFVREHFGL